MKKAAPTISEEDLLKQFDEADLDGDSMLFFEEFEIAAKKAEELVKSQDPNTILFNSLDTIDPKG